MRLRNSFVDTAIDGDGRIIMCRTVNHRIQVLHDHRFLLPEPLHLPPCPPSTPTGKRAPTGTAPTQTRQCELALRATRNIVTRATHTARRSYTLRLSHCQWPDMFLSKQRGRRAPKPQGGKSSGFDCLLMRHITGARAQLGRGTVGAASTRLVVAQVPSP